MKRKLSWREGVLGLSVLLLAGMLALRLGSSPEATLEIIIELRLPRVILAIAVGMGLSVAGAVLQSLFSNPLCEPYTLGVSSGAALGAVIGIGLGATQASPGVVSVCALIGASLVCLVLTASASRARWKSVELLLVGVMAQFFCASLIALWMALKDPLGVQSAVFWLMGDLSRARLAGAVTALGSVFLLTLAAWRSWRELDAFLLGEEEARAIGIEVERARRRLLWIASALVAVCVSLSGQIGFIGLLVPHLARRWLGPLHRSLIPSVALVGAVILVVSDLVARAGMRPYELPVGVVTALAGAPVFIWLLRRRA